MTSNYILVDLDDTILQCSDILQKYLEDEFGLYSDQRLRDVHDIPNMYGLDLEQTLKLIASFHRSACMENMPPDPSASAVLPELHRRGYRFVAITACLDEPDVLAARLRNLQWAFGIEWQEVHCIGLTPCKKAALERYPASIWVDDLTRHAIAGAEVGHRAFLINKRYNQTCDHPLVTRVQDWHEVMWILEGL